MFKTPFQVTEDFKGYDCVRAEFFVSDQQLDKTSYIPWKYVVC